MRIFFVYFIYDFENLILIVFLHYKVRTYSIFLKVHSIYPKPRAFNHAQNNTHLRLEIPPTAKHEILTLEIINCIRQTKYKKYLLLLENE